MSDSYVRFIPENAGARPGAAMLEKIGSIDWGGSKPKIIDGHKLLFADAGQNFESVSCPYCESDLIGWWGACMDAAYSEENGFRSIEITTPCCGRHTSLHNLEYIFQQGFYRTMIEVDLSMEPRGTADEILRQLEGITGFAWRTIHARY